MRPYLAVIADSFRAAFNSRVLWVAFIAIYVFLIAIAPIGYREVYTTTIRWSDLTQNGTRMKYLLARDLDASRKTPAGQIARAMPEELRSNLRKVAEGNEVRISLDLLAGALTGLLDRDDWYDESVWANTVKLRELRELDAKESSELSDDLKRRRNRLRIEAALPGVFENRGARSIALTYAGIDFPAIFQVDPAQFQMLLNHFVLRLIIDWLLGFIMIFLGILVTAAIIPDMLQPGSLHLLLSKPVSRTLLFLSKFIGGCAFVLLCVSQLIIGLWLISGFRLGLWNHRLLYCIPVCVFLFAVFYSVSAVAGLRWRSPILSIALTNIFGAVCLFIGIAGGVADGFIDEPDRIESFVVVDDTVIAATRGAKLRRLEAAEQQWQDLFPDDPGQRDRLLAPVQLNVNQVATARVRGGRMNWFGSGATPVLLLDRNNEWKPMQGRELPTTTSQLLRTHQGRLIAANSAEVSVMTGELEMSDGQTDAGDDNESLDKSNEPAQSGLFGKLMQMMGASTAGFEPLTPANFPLNSPRSIVFSQSKGDCYIASSDRITLFSQAATEAVTSPTPWSLRQRISLELGNRNVWIGLGSQWLIVFRQKEPPRAFSRSLQPLEMKLDIPLDFTQLAIATVHSNEANDALAIVTLDGQVQLLKATLDAEQTLTLRGQQLAVSDADAVAFDSQNRCWVSHHVDRFSIFDSDSGKRINTITPAVQGWRRINQLVVTPLRTVTPQTGELSETIAAIVSGEDAIQLPFEDEGNATERYNVWRPVLTCAGFIVFMLTIGCVYFARTDF